MKKGRAAGAVWGLFGTCLGVWRAVGTKNGVESARETIESATWKSVRRGLVVFGAVHRFGPSSAPGAGLDRGRRADECEEGGEQRPRNRWTRGEPIGERRMIGEKERAAKRTRAGARAGGGGVPGKREARGRRADAASRRAKRAAPGRHPRPRGSRTGDESPNRERGSGGARRPHREGPWTAVYRPGTGQERARSGSGAVRGALG